jgi:FlaA1/EpsC-like NDP-sugar epimerase
VLSYDVAGFVDDDPAKQNQTIHGIPVLGTVADMSRVIERHKVKEIIISVSAVPAARMRRIVGLCEATGLTYKTMPGLWEVLEGRVSLSAARKVRYEDLLGREPIRLDMEQVGAYLTGRRIMVTGGAGSIGSELCRQISRYKPEALIIVDQNESGLYEIELGLQARFPCLKTAAVLGPVQSKNLMARVFAKHGPHVVFHAAAYKHVPMMELHPWEAVFNNILGTRNILELSRENRVDRCVVVSTDKAVRPTNVMGASKRVGEILTRSFAAQNNTRFMAVRFGNVVGSIGSVVPLFTTQIERGGPVTVTHPEVTRFFMTIPEACGLILQTGAIGKYGEIFVLKMGTPIRIADMARDIITLHGLTPGVDIEIRFTGLRPGEKLYEELITKDEGIQKTQHQDILVLNANEPMPMAEINRNIDELVAMAEAGDGPGIKKCLRMLVPEYNPQ